MGLGGSFLIKAVISEEFSPSLKGKSDAVKKPPERWRDVYGGGRRRRERDFQRVTSREAEIAAEI